uniref:Uncharacterized protein n=1 Tax=Anguilla anguilla TaxID=7936 RepID=A0A0E9PJN9_ANGAN
MTSISWGIELGENNLDKHLQKPMPFYHTSFNDHIYLKTSFS